MTANLSLLIFFKPRQWFIQSPYSLYFFLRLQMLDWLFFVHFKFVFWCVGVNLRDLRRKFLFRVKNDLLMAWLILIWFCFLKVKFFRWPVSSCLNFDNLYLVFDFLNHFRFILNFFNWFLVKKFFNLRRITRIWISFAWMT